MGHRFTLFSFITFLFFTQSMSAQTGIIGGVIKSGSKPGGYATVALQNSAFAAVADSTGQFFIQGVPVGSYTIGISLTGHQKLFKKVEIRGTDTLHVDFDLVPTRNDLDEIVVTGTLKEVRRVESAVPVEVYTPVL